MVSTSEVVCNTSTPRDIYFSHQECVEDKTIVEDSSSESEGDEGSFRRKRRKRWLERQME